MDPVCRNLRYCYNFYEYCGKAWNMMPAIPEYHNPQHSLHEDFSAVIFSIQKYLAIVKCANFQLIR